MPKSATNTSNPPKTQADSLEQPIPTFEDAMTDLQEIVNNLEDNSLGLEVSLAQFERGIGLLRQCHAFLEKAEQKIEVLINFKANGEPTVAPFDATPTAGSSEAKTLF